MSIAFEIKLTRTVALATGQALLVHLGSFTLEAGDLLSARIFFVCLRHQNIALDLLLADDHVLHLIAALDCLDGWLAAAEVLGFHSGLVAGDGCLSAGCNLHIACLDAPSHHANTVFGHQLFHVGLHVLTMFDNFVATHTDLVRYFFVKRKNLIGQVKLFHRLLLLYLRLHDHRLIERLVQGVIQCAALAHLLLKLCHSVLDTVSYDKLDRCWLHR